MTAEVFRRLAIALQSKYFKAALNQNFTLPSQTGCLIKDYVNFDF
ncbi:hypothetical protein [Microcoleus sp. FACHB-831]|nr:hypothetical protein [Microcoleus sp. FACHB-831]